MKHLKLFNQASEYEAYMEGEDVVLPNVSYIVEFKDLPANDPKKSVLFASKQVEPTSSYIAVDLGLPSGTLWADRNIGASSPDDAGLYFQWGDTVGYAAEQVANGEKVFASDWSDYFDTTDGGSTFNKYNKSGLRVLEASDDAATVNMGSEYRMPTKTEMQELINNTTATFVDLQGNEYSQTEALSGAITANNFKGVKMTGSNGNSIFIPASCSYYDSLFHLPYYNSFLLSANLYSYNIKQMYHAGFTSSGGTQIYSDYRYIGLPVRGVCKNNL